MPNVQKRVIITLRPEWEPVLRRLQQEKFNDVTQAQMLRYIIDLGLASAKDEQLTRRGNGREDP